MMRSWVLFIVLSAMLAFAAACGSDDDDTDADAANEADTATEVSETEAPETEPEPTETPVPEPTATEVAEPAATEVPESEPTEEPEDEGDEKDSDVSEPGTSDSGASGDLEGLLLSIDDLPAGWTETLDDVGGESEVGDVSEDPFNAPCGIQPIEESYDPIAEAARSFQGTELGPFLSQNLVQLNSADEAAEMISLMRELFGCDEWVETDEFGDEVTFDIAEVPFEGAGNDSFALEVGLSFEDDPEMEMFGDFVFEFVFLQRNEFVSMFMYVDIFGMSEADFESLVRRGDEKLQ